MLEYIVIFLCIVSIILFKNSFRKESQDIMLNGELTIGTVLIYSSSKPTIHAPKTINQPGQSQSVKFEYLVKNKKYIHTYGGNKGFIPSEGVVIGQKYLVKYLKRKPQKSRMLFDYPIKDSTDFKLYLKKFKNELQKAIKIEGDEVLRLLFQQTSD